MAKSHALFMRKHFGGKQRGFFTFCLRFDEKYFRDTCKSMFCYLYSGALSCIINKKQYLGEFTMPDFKVLSNLHTHTVFSDGANSVEENIRAALEAGFVSVGFSDHSYVPEAGFGVSRDNAASYIGEVRRCSKAFADKIDVFCGLELDADTPFDRELYDYIIASVHFVKADGKLRDVDLSPAAQTECIERYFDGDGVKYAKAYFDTLAEHVERTRPDIVGHFDLLTKFGVIDETDDAYRRCALDALRRISSVTRRFEVNTGAMARKLKSTPYPADFILKEILSLDCSVILSSDAHRAVNIDYAFSETAAYLREIGFKYTDRLTTHGFVRDEL